MDLQNTIQQMDADSTEIMDAVSTITTATHQRQSNITPTQLPMIRPAIFANNLSHVANFYRLPDKQPKILKLTDRIDVTQM